jgi:hypothetical protein
LFLAYVLVSMAVIIAFGLAVFVTGWFVGRLHERAADGGEKSESRAQCMSAPVLLLF